MHIFCGMNTCVHLMMLCVHVASNHWRWRYKDLMDLNSMYIHTYICIYIYIYIIKRVYSHTSDLQTEAAKDDGKGEAQAADSDKPPEAPSGDSAQQQPANGVYLMCMCVYKLCAYH